MVKQHTRETYELLFDSAAGDIEAYKELFERYSEKLYNFVYYLTYSREESEDITSETFIKVFEALQGRDVASFNFQAYLYKTAKNLSLNAIARKKREGLTLEEAEDFAESSIFADPERASLLSDQRAKVKDASGKLTEDQQAALLLKELENLPYGTIAEVLDSNPNAVGALLSRARLKFKEVYRMTHAQTEGMPDACKKITPLLSAYIDKEAAPQERQMIEDHLASCPICNANLESMQEASTTYRSLIPILPLATFKVWNVAQGALVGGKVAADAATAAGAAGAGATIPTGASIASRVTANGGSAAAATGATTAGHAAATRASATRATTAAPATVAGVPTNINSSLVYKIIAIAIAGLIAVGIGVGVFFTVSNISSPKQPNNGKSKGNELNSSQINTQNTEKNKSAVTQKPKIQDCIGFDYQRIPRYSGSTRVRLEIGMGMTYIVYTTDDSVQKVANFYVGALPEWHITNNNSETFSAASGSSRMEVQKDLAYNNKTAVSFWADDDWETLKTDDPTLHLENYPDQPSSNAIKAVEEKQDVTGQDVSNTRPSNCKTVRVSYSTSDSSHVDVEYLAAESMGLLVIEYVSRGFVIDSSEKSTVQLKPTGRIYPLITLTTSDEDLTNIKVKNVEGY